MGTFYAILIDGTAIADFGLCCKDEKLFDIKNFVCQKLFKYSIKLLNT